MASARQPLLGAGVTESEIPPGDEVN
jgi:hypothetical protein